jgi:hypothetical protein
VAKESFGKNKTKEQLARSKRDGNPGGERQEGRLVKHVDMAAGRTHIARYTSALCCSVCGLAL